ncbi:acyl-CoA dehydrogenase [Rathayibacter toxicus]|uniref:acyl-CoA dehydrogenase family protein n=1 Tax=Rathayibacter toxicus TaxID=145458 RepID=UPI000CE89DA9|nr:acyl-CoA dehydrogenase [Rathayibacter toxicus]PPH62538.1 acyl-CoA dehydrogenase [Rathayibacter toxicus]PPI44372.1 acyl-CoA dehydrogenase [Rathayibacter toxicus]QWL50415.1 acyl-CoA dehydrogenase [Rathayibacter toxicus]
MVSTAPRPGSPADDTNTAVGSRAGSVHSNSGAVTPPTTSPSNEADARLDLDGAPTIDVAALSEILLGNWREQRLASRALTARKELQRIDGLSMTEHRARVSQQLRILASEGGVHRAFPRDLGGEADHGGNVAGFEELVIADPSLQIKSGVQWGLFGSAVLHLGTREHHEKWLRGIMSLEIPGVFAMTETGHGSDVASIATTATFDTESGDFILHTPFRAAWKDYLGNAAVDGRAAVVFAQLVTGGVKHGVHAFYVPIRQEQGAFLPGIGGEDDGLKGGLNGVDNGRLHFNQVRVPRENLLNRYGNVAADGSYSSLIASPGRRFFTMLGTLVQGRVSLDGAAVAAAKIALTIAVTYGNQRRQFRDAHGREEVLLDYQRHQRRLLPRLATTYAAGFAHEQLLHIFDGVFSGANDTDESRQDLETLAAGLKALSTWHALDTLQEAREACGGAGFLAENRLTQLRADLDVYSTFEGDNTVLLQLVAKRLLHDVGRRFTSAQPGERARYVASQVAKVTVNNSGVRRLAQVVVDHGSTARSVCQLREEQHELLKGRVEGMITGIASQLRSASLLSTEEVASVFAVHQNELIEAARAHAELVQWEAFTHGLTAIDDPNTRTVLTWLRDLFGLGLIEKHLAWYLMHGQLSSQRARAVTSSIDRLLTRLRPHAADLVAAFGYGPEHLRSAIASGAEPPSLSLSSPRDATYEHDTPT